VVRPAGATNRVVAERRAKEDKRTERRYYGAEPVTARSRDFSDSLDQGFGWLALRLALAKSYSTAAVTLWNLLDGLQDAPHAPTRRSKWIGFSITHQLRSPKSRAPIDMA
jgi:hypothetical protein